MLNLKVIGVPEHFNYPWHRGIDSGAFEKVGVSVDWTDVPGGTGAMMTQIREGEADVAVVLTQGAIARILDGDACRIVKTYVESPLIWGIHVAADSPLKDIEEIQGRTYAISRQGSGSHLMSIVDASERGWPADSPKFEIVGGLEGARKALANGSADIFFWEKFTTDPYVQNGEFRLIGVRETIWPAFVIVARNELIEANGSLLAAMLTELNQQCSAVTESSDSVEQIASMYKLEPSETAQWKSVTRWSCDFSSPTAGINTAIAYIDRLGIADGSKATVDDIWHNLV